jgi:hypothetical protein
VPLRALLTLVALALCSVAAELPDPAKIRDTAGTLTRTLEVQPQLPNSAGTPEPSTVRRKGWNLWGMDDFSVPAPGAVLNLLQWALVAVLVIAILALLAIMFYEPAASHFRPPASFAHPEPEPVLADPRALLALADQFAAEGRHAEAMHHVLLAATAMLGRRQPHKSADSLTSWELLRTASLAPPQLQALRDLVVRVERAWFGKRPAALDDYQHVRGCFDAFASPAPEPQ